MQAVEDRLHDAPLLGGGAAQRRKQILVLARLEGLVAHADLAEQPLEVQVDEDHADRPRHRRRVGHDLIGRAGHVVAAGRGEVAERRDHRDLVLPLETDELAVHLVARGDAAPRAVDAEHEGLHPLVLGGLLELGLDAADRRLLLDQPEGVPGREVRDHAGDVDEQDLVAALALDRGLLERPLALQDAERVPEDDEAARRPEGERGEEGEPPHRRGPAARPPCASRWRSRMRSISSRGSTRSSSRICRIGTSRAMAFLNRSAARS